MEQQHNYADVQSIVTHLGTLSEGILTEDQKMETLAAALNFYLSTGDVPTTLDKVTDVCMACDAFIKGELSSDDLLKGNYKRSAH